MSISSTNLKPPRQGLARTERRSIWPAGIAACRRDCQKQQGDACLKLCLKIAVIILLLSILQKILDEFGIMKVLTSVVKWPMKLFGLSQKSSFLWIVANTLGLAYGAAVMFQEKESGHIGDRDIQLLNTHISISHSNIEDLILFASIGGIWWVILLSRWAASLFLVWAQRLEFYIRDRFTKFAG